MPDDGYAFTADEIMAMPADELEERARNVRFNRLEGTVGEIMDQFTWLAITTSLLHEVEADQTIEAIDLEWMIEAFAQLNAQLLHMHESPDDEMLNRSIAAVAAMHDLAQFEGRTTLSNIQWQTAFASLHMMVVPASYRIAYQIGALWQLGEKFTTELIAAHSLWDDPENTTSKQILDRVICADDLYAEAVERFENEA